MLKRLSEREILEQLAADWEPAIRAAWREALANISSSIILARLIEHLEKGDVAGAIDALNLEPEMFSRVEVAIVQAYNAGGLATVDAMPHLMDPQGNRVVFTWGVRNLAGEQEIRRHAADLARGITQDMKDGIREVLTKNLAEGRSPNAAVRAVVGRGKVDPTTGMRQGGVLGLTRQQMEHSESLREALTAGDIAKMREIIGMRADGTIDPEKGWKLRDKRFDRSIAKAIREETGLPTDTVSRAVGQYQARALDYRGRILSRHETMVALDKSRDDAFRQQINAGKIAGTDITKTWKHTPRTTERWQHRKMQGQEVGFEESFLAPDGTKLRYPRDPDAPASHTLNCFCRAEYRLNYTEIALRRYRARTGQ